MKVALVCINAKYIHSSLGIRSIAKYAEQEGIDVDVFEYSINHNEFEIAMDIFKRKYDVVAFSCYIFNIDYVLKVASVVRKASPNVKIWFGGPEVSFDPKEYLKLGFVDGIMIGEGEKTFYYLAISGFDGKNVAGVAYKREDNVIVNMPRTAIQNLDEIPFAYSEEDLLALKDRIIYYETSRGCPFSCSYCLSSTDHGVRYFSMERVKRDLLFFMEHDIPLVKFVDRTFNASNQRACEIMKFASDHSKSTTFHFEISANLMTDGMANIVANAREGLFQFEIGIQSTNKPTLDEVCRYDEFDRIKATVEKLKATNKTHVHVDLIAGLPHETYKIFRKSFNDVYCLKADDLQLGFLKLLKGSKIRRESEKFKYQYTDFPPYEVISNEFINFDSLLALKEIEDILEKYYNSGGFSMTMEHIESKYGDAFSMYLDIAKYFCETNQNMMPHAKRKLYDILFEFYKSKFSDFKELSIYLMYDLCKNMNIGSMPYWYLDRKNDEFRKKCLEFLSNEENVKKNLAEYQSINPKKILKNVYFEIFDFDPNDPTALGDIVYLFDKIARRAIRISEII